MSSRDDLKIEMPYFGSANQDEPEADIVEKQQALARKQFEGREGNWLNSIILILLTASLAVMGYFGVELRKSVEAQKVQAQASDKRILELEQLLAATKAEAQKSGQSFEQKLEAQKKAMDDAMSTQYKAYETQFAELIASAKAQQQAQLQLFDEEIEKLDAKVKNAQEDAQEEMGFMTSQQKTALAGLEDRLSEMAQLRTALTNLEIAQTKTQTDKQALEESIANLKANYLASNSARKSDLASQKKELDALDKALDTYKVSQHKVIDNLANKVAALAKKAAPKLDAAVVARLSKTEQAIKAIDGSRAKVNQDILRLKSKVNKIQLQLQ
ncbi:MAG: hypothetical protein ACPG4U_04165 [Pseudomonadales bacterium]